MYLCYIDESGTPDLPGNTSHFILAGLSIPDRHWKQCDREIEAIKAEFGIEDAEIHIAWILRPYLEQRKITDFASLDRRQRKAQVESYRRGELLRLQRAGNPKLYRQVKTNYRQTASYVHLTYEERKDLAVRIADAVSRWDFARLFAECVDKVYFDPSRSAQNVGEQSFEQIVSRFEQYLRNMEKAAKEESPGILIYDNNVTVARRHTDLMKRYHRSGTFWTRIEKIIETPLFVDSQLTSMV